jgi:hypothetical protein
MRYELAENKKTGEMVIITTNMRDDIVESNRQLGDLDAAVNGGTFRGPYDFLNLDGSLLQDAATYHRDRIWHELGCEDGTYCFSSIEGAQAELVPFN